MNNQETVGVSSGNHSVSTEKKHTVFSKKSLSKDKVIFADKRYSVGVV